MRECSLVCWGIVGWGDNVGCAWFALLISWLAWIGVFLLVLSWFGLSCLTWLGWVLLCVGWLGLACVAGLVCIIVCWVALALIGLSSTSSASRWDGLALVGWHCSFVWRG